MQVTVGTAKNKASVRTIPLPLKVVELLKKFPFEKGGVQLLKSISGSKALSLS